MARLLVFRRRTTAAWIAAASLLSAVSMVAWSGAVFGSPSTESGKRARERGSEGGGNPLRTNEFLCCAVS